MTSTKPISNKYKYEMDLWFCIINVCIESIQSSFTDRTEIQL